MNRSFLNVTLWAALVAVAVGEGPVLAQVFHTPGGTPVVPAPPSPPPPAVTIPQVPQMASPPKFELGNTGPSLIEQNPQPRQNLKPLSQQKSFGQRVTRCLDEGAALGLGPGERSAYSRACAQQ